MPFPLQPTTQPGIKQFLLTSSVVAAATSQAVTVTLPEQGTYLLVIVGWIGNQTVSGALHALVTYANAYPVLPQFLMRKTSTLGDLATSGNAGFAGMTVADPDASGNLAVTLTKTDANNTQWEIAVTAYQLSSGGFFASA